ncbi:MAG: dUTP diphosphatase [Pseudomonadota bacterium]
MTDSSAQLAATTMLNEMAELQEAHNTQVHPQWRTQGYAYYRAIWVECAEMLDHFAWKWWKKQDADIEQVKLELVDIWHFALSDMLRADTLSDTVAAELDAVVPTEQVDAEAFRQAVEQLAESSLRCKGFELAPFLEAMRTLPMSLLELHGLYVGKNVLNRFRQDHGYKNGTYHKTWQGREDNEHLVELLTSAREELATADAPVSFAEQLYAALAARYAELTPSYPS